jgi:hypothetical protein
MKAVAVVVVVVALLALGALAEDSPPHPHKKPVGAAAAAPPPPPARQGTHASHGSHSKIDPVKIAKKLNDLLGGSEGSIEFTKDGKAVPGTIAKKDPKPTLAAKATQAVQAVKQKVTNVGKQIKAGINKVKGSGHAAAPPPPPPAKTSPKLFDFKTVKPGTAAVGIKKTTFKTYKHSPLILQFCNANPHVTVVVSIKEVKTAKSMLGAAKAFMGNLTKPKKKEPLITGVLHKNLFIVQNGVVVYPEGFSSGASDSGHSHGSAGALKPNKLPKNHLAAKNPSAAKNHLVAGAKKALGKH